MRRKSNQNTYSQTISQSTYKPNKVYNYSSYQKEKAHFISKTNPIPVRIINNIKENRLEQRDTNQRQYQQKLIIRNPNLIGNKEYYQQNKIRNNKDKNEYINNAKKKDFDLSKSQKMNITFQFNNVSIYYSYYFKKNTDDASKNKSCNIIKKILTRNQRENIKKQKRQKKRLYLINKMDKLINEIKTETEEMKKNRIKISSFIEESKKYRIASQRRVNTFIEESKKYRIDSQRRVNSFIEESKKYRIDSQKKINSFIEESKKYRIDSQKRFNSLMTKMEKFRNISKKQH